MILFKFLRDFFWNHYPYWIQISTINKRTSILRYPSKFHDILVDLQDHDIHDTLQFTIFRFQRIHRIKFFSSEIMQFLHNTIKIEK